MKFNYIVIMTDGARSDFAMNPKVMPVTHNFLRENGGILFSNVYSTSTWTLPPQMSLFTGLLPTNHGLSDITYSNRRQIVQAVDKEFFKAKNVLEKDFLVNILKGQGYTTKIWSNYITYQFMAKTHHHYFDKTTLWDFFYWQTDKVINEPIEKPFFHFMYDDDGGHAPYGVGIRDRRIHFDQQRSKMVTDTEARARPGIYTEPVLKSLVRKQLRQYDAEKLSKFWEWFKENNLHKDTVVFILSDHGECYAEHGWTGHVANCYEPIVKIPVLMYHPNARTLVRDKEIRSIVDLVPTILNEPEFGDGKSMYSSDSDRVVFFEFTRKAEPIKRLRGLPMSRLFIRGLRHKNYKFLYQILRDGRVQIELYDLAKNPREIFTERLKDKDLLQKYRGMLQEKYGVLSRNSL